MTRNNSRTLEFLSLTTMSVGMVVGSGIFMKNNQLLLQTGNPIVAIILWLMVGLVSIVAVYAFLQISSSTIHQGNGTISIWAKLFINRKISSLFAVIYTYFYFPVCQGIFATGFATFLLLLINVNLSVGSQLLIFLLTGPFWIILIGLMVGFKNDWSKKFQIFGTFFKFIPLFVALVAGFCLIDKTSGADGTSTIWNGTGVGTGIHPWSATEYQLGLFIRGFGPILFAFDGFIYIANAQKTAKHKDVVTKAIICGMIFVATFYVLMAISLFLGSPDGSVVQLLNKLFGINSNAGRIISNIVLLVICVIGMNTFSYLGVIEIQSSSDAKVLYSGSKGKGFNSKQSAFIQIGISLIYYFLLVLMGALLKNNNPLIDGNNVINWQGVNTKIPKGIDSQTWLSWTTNTISSFSSTLSTAGAVLSFFMVGTILISAVFNEKTKKMRLPFKVKGFKTASIISAAFIFFFITVGLLSFIIPIDVWVGKKMWTKSDGPGFVIAFFSMLIFCSLAFLIQEYLFRLHPYQTGFNGFLAEEKHVESPLYLDKLIK